MAQKIAILDYSAGNLHSVSKKIARLNAQPVVCKNATDLLQCDKVVLPGVGHFATAMQHLKSTHLLEAVQEVALVHRKPVLGICLGLQLMANSSEEAPGCDGLGWLEADVVRFHHANNHIYRTPHTGWNTIRSTQQSSLLHNLPPSAEFFFTHAYHLHFTTAPFVIAETEYGYPFVAAVEQNNLFGVQFHPEKSHAAGEALLKNFLSL